MTTKLGLAALLTIALVTAACERGRESGSSSTASPKAEGTMEGKTETTASGLQYVDVKPGTGPSPQAGQMAVVHYTGWLADGKKFDSSRDRGDPFRFPLGGGKVIKGWDQGIAGMKVGAVRKLTIPPHLAYGPRGFPPVIPPNAILVFEVELLELR